MNGNAETEQYWAGPVWQPHPITKTMGLLRHRMTMVMGAINQLKWRMAMVVRTNKQMDRHDLCAAKISQMADQSKWRLGMVLEAMKHVKSCIAMVIATNRQLMWETTRLVGEAINQ